MTSTQATSEREGGKGGKGYGGILSGKRARGEPFAVRRCFILSVEKTNCVATFVGLGERGHIKNSGKKKKTTKRFGKGGGETGSNPHSFRS